MNLQLLSISLKEAPLVQKYAGNKKIADTTASIPNPYPDGAAEAFIRDALQKREILMAYVFAIYRDDEFVGVCSLFNIDWKSETAEIGYWIGVPFWGNGLATGGVTLLIEEARLLGLKKLVGKALQRNPSSRRVMEKNGFRLSHESVGCGRHTNDAIWEMERNIV